MRICLVTSAPFPHREGLGYHIWNLAGELTRAGHRAHIVTRGNLRRATVERREGISIWRLPFAPLYPFHVHLHGLFVNRFLRAFERHFDLVNEHSPLPPVVNTTLPLVTTVHSPMRADTAATKGMNWHTLTVRLQTPVSQSIESGIFRRSKRITVVAGWVAEALQVYGIDPASITVTGNGVEQSFLAEPLPAEREPFALYVGRLEPGKGLEDLIAAARIYVSRCPESALRFKIAGTGSLREALEGQVRQAGLDDRFDFLGQVGGERRGDLQNLYRRTAVFVLPSHHEGMPTVLLEAMASGAPSIATAVGGAPEVVKHDVNGYLVPAHSPAALANGLVRLTDDELGRRLGVQARETIAEHYSWGAVSLRYLECFRQVLGEKENGL